MAPERVNWKKMIFGAKLKLFRLVREDYALFLTRRSFGEFVIMYRASSSSCGLKELETKKWIWPLTQPSPICHYQTSFATLGYISNIINGVLSLIDRLSGDVCLFVRSFIYWFSMTYSSWTLSGVCSRRNVTVISQYNIIWSRGREANWAIS